MARLNLLLLIAVLGTALFLVHTQYRSRQLFTELERVNSEAHRLEVEYERLQVDKRAQATPLRVEKLAKEQLKMRTTTPAITLYVRQDGSVIPAVVAPPPAPPPVTQPRAAAPAARGSTP
ncbi:MAG: cell division protein FtsL [Variovorax sp.]|nr:MAG: cell division protein FtsL [Variovorax sp.]